MSAASAHATPSVLSMMEAQPHDEDTLVDLLDRLLDKGVVISGDLRISVAEVDLIFVGLKLFVSSVDTIENARGGAPSTRQSPAALEPSKRNEGEG